MQRCAFCDLFEPKHLGKLLQERAVHRRFVEVSYNVRKSGNSENRLKKGKIKNSIEKKS